MRLGSGRNSLHSAPCARWQPVGLFVRGWAPRRSIDPADADIAKSLPTHLFRAEHIPSVDDQGLLDRRTHSLPVYLPEFVPLGNDQDGIGTFGRLVRVGAVGNLGKDCPGFLAGLGIVGTDSCALGEQ